METLLNERINLSRELLIGIKPDYADKEAKFVELATADRSLVDKMNASSNPAKFAYETAKKALEQEAKLKLVDEIGDPAEYREKLKAELLAELRGEAPPAATRPQAIVGKAPNLATASAARSGTERVGDDLESLFTR